MSITPLSQWAYTDAICDADEVLTTEQTGARSSGPVVKNTSGSALKRLKGNYTGPDTKEYVVKAASVGTTSSSLSGVQPIPTLPKQSHGSQGNGTCTVESGADADKTFDLTLTCKKAAAGSNATIEGVLAGHFINEKTGEEGEAGNGGAITIEKQTSGAYTWGRADTGRILSANALEDATSIKYIGTSVIFSAGDLIEIGSATPSGLTDIAVHMIADIDTSGGGSVVQLQIYPPVPAGGYSSGTSIYKVTATSGFKVTCTDTDSVATVYHGHDTWGSPAPIRFMLELLGVLNYDTGLDSGGSPEDGMGYEFNEIAATANDTYSCLNAELLTFAGGIDASSTVFEASAYPVPTESQETQLISIGSLTTLWSGTDWECRVLISEGTVSYTTGDIWEDSLVQCQMQVSTDRGVNYGSDIEVNDSSWQDNTADIEIGDGLKINITCINDYLPFVQGDETWLTYGYSNGWRSLRDQGRFKTHRTKTADNKLVYWIDSGAGKSFDADYLAITDHNLTDSAVIKVHGLLTTKIEQCRGVVTSKLGNVVYITFDRAPGVNDFQTGKMYLCSGDNTGDEFTISSNAVDSITVPDATNITIGDYIGVIPPSGWLNYTDTLDTPVADSHLYGCGLDSGGGNYRGWIVEISDTTNTNGKLEASMVRLTKIMYPQDNAGLYCCHDYIKEIETKYNYSQVITSGGVAIRTSRGIFRKIYSIEYSVVSETEYNALVYMGEYCNASRARAVMFWPLASDTSDFKLGFIDIAEQSEYNTINYGVVFEFLELLTEDDPR